MNFAVFGAGAWGTAMAIHLDRAGHAVSLVPAFMEDALELASKRENRFLPGYRLPESLQIGLEAAPILLEAEVVVMAPPSKFLRSLCRELKASSAGARQLQLAVTISKGLEEGTNATPGEVVTEELSDWQHGVISGPCFAHEVAAGKPTAAAFASEADSSLVTRVQTAMSDSHLRLYRSNDIRGVELGGCMKNVYAIASGMCDGLGLGHNTKAALLTRSLAEMIRVGVALGGKAETFFGLSGVGDLALTCHGPTSRNRTFGERLARGEPARQLIEGEGMTVEGYRSAACFAEICQAKQIDAPILSEIAAILFQGKEPSLALRDLMGRELKAEFARS